jgi:HEPN domain-containing protein
VARAEEDSLMMQSAIRRRAPLIYSACFHAQQCAEKYLKAILISKKQDFPRTHDLLLLNDLCEKAGVIIGVNPQLLNTLSDYAIRIRYPGVQPDAADAREAIRIARVVRRTVRKLLGF